MKLIVQNIAKRFTSLRGSITALDNVSVEIANGEFFVLLGPSGCGKSTFLNILAGLEEPSSGKMLFDDQLIADARRNICLSPKQRNVAFVFQSYALYPHLTVFENIAFPLRVSHEKKSTIKPAVEKAAATLEITELLKARPAELSGGQRQRVAIARAIVRQPNLFLLDEPLSNLDARLRIAMRAELKDLQQRFGVTTVYVTHDQSEAMALGDRIAVMNKSKIEQIGSAADLYDNPASIFVAEFIGSPPMNLIPSSTIQQDGNLYMILGQQRFEIPPQKIRDFKKFGSSHFIFGIRPEYVHIDKDTAHANARILSVEPLGRENIIHLRLDGHTTITALSQDTDYQKDQPVTITLDIPKSSLFQK